MRYLLIGVGHPLCHSVHYACGRSAHLNGAVYVRSMTVCCHAFLRMGSDASRVKANCDSQTDLAKNVPKWKAWILEGVVRVQRGTVVRASM